MPKISNDKVYIPDNTYSDNDSWVGSDNQDTNKTKTYTLAGVSDYISKKFGLIQNTTVGSGILSGNYYNIPNTYSYFVWTDNYVIASVEYSGYISDTLTLEPSDSEYNRIDAIVVNNDNTISVITGFASENPSSPSIDYNTQVLFTFIIVEADTDSSQSVINTTVYNENLQILGGEFDTNNIRNADLEYQYEYNSGAMSIYFNGDSIVEFIGDNEIGTSRLYNIVFQIKLFNNTGHKLFVAIGNTNTSTGGNDGLTLEARMTDLVAIENGVFGFDSSNTTDWQTIIIPFNAFQNSLPFDRVWLQSSNPNSQLYIDNIFVQDGIALSSQNTITRTSQLFNDGESGTPFVTEIPRRSWSYSVAKYETTGISTGVWNGLAPFSNTIRFNINKGTSDLSLVNSISSDARFFEAPVNCYLSAVQFQINGSGSFGLIMAEGGTDNFLTVLFESVINSQVINEIFEYDDDSIVIPYGYMIRPLLLSDATGAYGSFSITLTEI